MPLTNYPGLMQLLMGQIPGGEFGQPSMPFVGPPQGMPPGLLPPQAAPQGMEGGGGGGVLAPSAPQGEPAAPPIPPQYRQAGLAAPAQDPNAPQGFQGGNLGELYGLMAQYGDPTQALQGYVSANQQQQVIDKQNDPGERFLRMYGAINPHDYEPNSIQNFHENMVSTGQYDFSLLKERKGLTTVEQKIMDSAIDDAEGAHANLGQMRYLYGRFKENPNIAAGYAGSVNEFLKRALGTESQDEITLYRKQFELLKNSEVLRYLPPGPATDRDINLVRAGFPEGTSDPVYIANYLRASMKVRAAELAFKRYKATHLSLYQDQRNFIQDWERDRDRELRGVLGEFEYPDPVGQPGTGAPAPAAGGGQFDLPPPPPDASVDELRLYYEKLRAGQR